VAQWLLVTLALAPLLGSSRGWAYTQESPQTNNYANWQFLGSASRSGTEITVTPNQGGLMGHAWYKSMINVTSDFTVTFDVYLGNNDSGADGMALVFQTTGINATGASGGGLGALGIAPSMILKMDTWYNTETGYVDPVNADHLSLNKGTASAFQLWNNQYSTLANIEDGAYHRVQVDYVAATGALKVYWDGVRRINTTVNVSTTFLGGASQAYVGFSASTGGASNLQKLKIVSLITGSNPPRIDPDDDGYSNDVDTDDDGDGLSDTLEGSSDTDGDGIINSLDLDSDNDGINDVRESLLTDANGDGEADGTIGSTGIIASAPTSLRDTDGDGVPDVRDLDSDNDSIPDLWENGPSAVAAADTNRDGFLSTLDTGGTDVDGDGIMSAADGQASTWSDSSDPVATNTDGDGSPDYLDVDSDGDGIRDLVEAGRNAATLDPDGDGIIEAPQNADSDSDGLANDVDDNDAAFGWPAPQTPTVTTLAATSITTSAATLNASVNPNGLATTGSFSYSTSSTLASGVVTTAAQSLGSGSSAVSVPVTVTGLLGHRTYYFRASATSAGGTVTGSILSFTTLNNTPVAVDDSIVAPAGVGAFTVSAVSNDTDADSDTLTITSVTAGSVGTTSTNGTTITYTPGVNYGGNDTFTYTISDGFGCTASARVTISRAPTITTQAATGLSATAATLNASVNANGVATTAAFSYSLDAALASGVTTTSAQSVGSGITAAAASANLTGLLPHRTYYFRASASSSAGSTSGSILSFTTANRNPSAVADTLTAPAGSAAFSIAVLANDTDADSDTLTITSVTPGSLGSTAITGSTITFTPGAGYEGNDSFSYVISDGFGGSATGTVTIIRMPEVTTAAVSEILPVSATLNATALPRGLVASLAFEYSMDSGLASSTTTTPVAISTGPGSVAASAALASLSPGVRYYYRAVLTGAWGTVRGEVRDFLTPIFVWGEAGTSPIEGKLDATIIPNTTSSPVLYPNTSNRNFDVQLVTSGLGSNGLTTVLGEAAWWLEGSASSAPVPATVRVRFYRPGTTTPTALRGIHFRLEDAETNERCSDFSYFDADGNQVPLLWNSAAFTYSHKPRFNASGSEVENLAPTEGSIQHCKWIEIDLSGVAVSGFELRVKRMSVNNAGGIVMTALGGAGITGTTITGNFTPIAVDTTSDGYAPVPDYTRQATTSTGEPAVFKQVPAPGSLVLPGLRSIMLTGTLASGESAVTGFQLQVIDRTPPVIAAPSTGFTSLTLESNAAIPDYASQAVIADNVAVTSRTQSPAAGTLATVGTFPVTITATDAKGNTTSASLNVTVKPPADVPNEVQYVSYVATNAAADASGAPTGSTFTTFGVPSINDDGAMAYRAGLKRGTVTSTGLLCGNPAALVASVGEAAPGVDGAVFASFYDPCLNHGRGIQPAVAFLATIKAATGKTAIPTAFNTGLWTNLGGTVQLIARAGDGAPGCTGGLFKSITSVTFVENEVVFTATLSGAVTTANDAGSWAWNATTGFAVC